MDQDQIITLIAAQLPAQQIARATGLTESAVLTFAEQNRDRIADKVLSKIVKKVVVEDTIQELKEEVLKAIRARVNGWADLKELTDLLKVLSTTDVGQSTTVTQNNVYNLTFNELMRRSVGVTINQDGEVVSVDGRDMNPADKDQVRRLYDEQIRESA